MNIARKKQDSPIKEEEVDLPLKEDPAFPAEDNPVKRPSEEPTIPNQDEPWINPKDSQDT